MNFVRPLMFTLKTLYRRTLFAGLGWSAEETESLINLWGEANVQSKLNGLFRNCAIYEQIAWVKDSLGYHRMWEQ